MINKHGSKVRLTFKLEEDQVWLGTKGIKIILVCKSVTCCAVVRTYWKNNDGLYQECCIRTNQRSWTLSHVGKCCSELCYLVISITVHNNNYIFGDMMKVWAFLPKDTIPKSYLHGALAVFVHLQYGHLICKLTSLLFKRCTIHSMMCYSWQSSITALLDLLYRSWKGKGTGCSTLCVWNHTFRLLFTLKHFLVHCANTKLVSMFLIQ